MAMLWVGCEVITVGPSLLSFAGANECWAELGTYSLSKSGFSKGKRIRYFHLSSRIIRGDTLVLFTHSSHIPVLNK